MNKTLCNPQAFAMISCIICDSQLDTVSIGRMACCRWIRRISISFLSKGMIKGQCEADLNVPGKTYVCL